MGLGEAKRKTRLVGSAVTKNAAWTNDASLPGQRLLSSMGWSQGQGLGTSSQGTAVPIAMAFKMDNKGIGASRFEKEARKNGQADAWIGGGGELGDLFDRLNKTSAAPVEPTEKKSRKEKGKSEKGKSDKTGKDTPGDEHRSGCEASCRRKGKNREDGKGKEKGKEAEGEASPAVVEEAVRKVAAEMPHRMAHRAKFLRAKRLVGSDLASVNEILGIASPSSAGSPAPISSPLPTVAALNEVPQGAASEDEDKSEKRRGKRGREEGSGVADVDEKSARKTAKRQAKEERREKKEKRRRVKEGETAVEPASDPSFAAGGGMLVSSLSVQDYLQNKLILRRAAIVRRQREEEGGVWKRAALVRA